jgi:nucleoside-diphosphate-sugar epimerase
MKIFVTGATGVVGCRLIPLLLSAGHEVTAVARSSAGRAKLERQGATAVSLDLFDGEAVRRAVQGCEAVVNLATHIPRSMAQMCLPWAWHENDRLRRVASATLVEACIAASVPRFVQESFAPVYPDCGDRWIDETIPISPVRYNRTVADAEAAVDRFSHGGGAGVVLRFGAFYGADAVQTVDLIKWTRRGWAPLPGPANAYISSVSHDDAATAAAAAINLPSGIYNVVDDEPLTHGAFVESLAEALEIDPPRLPPAWFASLFGSLGKLMARSVRISNRKLRSAGDWVPTYPSVRQGWAAVVARLEASGGSAP